MITKIKLLNATLCCIGSEKYMYYYVPEATTTNIFDENISSDLDGFQKKETDLVFKKYASNYEKLYRHLKKIKILIKKSIFLFIPVILKNKIKILLKKNNI